MKDVVNAVCMNQRMGRTCGLESAGGYRTQGTSDLYPRDKKIPRKTTIVKSIGVFWKEKQLLILERTAQDRESIVTCNNGEKLKSKYR